ncbi:MAG TPA: histidine phosphatase family protein, partial [Petrotogaceae bacterium]|nr:histidine phosphatase family protein [Petrotogaceae bacterium]
MEKRHEGRADFPLTKLGIKQATLLSKWIAKKYSPDYILSSTLKRAAQTAELIGSETGVKVESMSELMEFNNGLLAGLLFEEAAVKYPRPSIKNLHDKIYEQESMIEFRSRAEV